MPQNTISWGYWSQLNTPIQLYLVEIPCTQFKIYANF